MRKMIPLVFLFDSFVELTSQIKLHIDNHNTVGFGIHFKTDTGISLASF